MASFPQPFHDGPADGSPRGGFDAQRFGIAFASPAPAAPNALPLTCCAITRFWSSVNSLACTFIEPLSRAAKIASGESFMSVSKLGARTSELAWPWQVEQFFSNNPRPATQPAA